MVASPICKNFHYKNNRYVYTMFGGLRVVVDPRYYTELNTPVFIIYIYRNFRVLRQPLCEQVTRGIEPNLLCVLFENNV